MKRATEFFRLLATFLIALHSGVTLVHVVRALVREEFEQHPQGEDPMSRLAQEMRRRAAEGSRKA